MRNLRVVFASAFLLSSLLPTKLRAATSPSAPVASPRSAAKALPVSQAAHPSSRLAKPFRIPTLDISDQKQRQITVEAIPGKYLGQPDTVLLADGKTLLVGYPEGHGHPNTILKKSTDGGLTWSERLPTPASFTDNHYAPTLHRLTDAKGIERLLIFVSYPWMRHSISTNNGATWTEFRPTFSGDLKGQPGYKGHAPPKSIIRLKNGNHLAMYHDHFKRDGKLVVELIQIESSDGGLTWSSPHQIGQHPDLPDAQPCEPGLIRSPDGKQILCLARENSRRYNSLWMLSDDEGKTWSDLKELPRELTGDRHDPHYAPDGRLITTFRDMAENSPTYGDFVLWVGTYDDVLARRAGQSRVRLLDNLGRPGDTGYAGMEILPDGTVISVTYCDLTDNGNYDPQIVGLRYRMSELDIPAARRLENEPR